MEAQATKKPATRRTSTCPADVAKIKNHHDMAFRFVNEGLNLEERGKINEAILCYEKGLRSIDSGVNIVTDEPQCTGVYWEKGRGFQSKMKAAREQIVSRLEELKIPESNGETEAEIPDSTNENDSSMVWEDVTPLVSVDEGVNLFHVDSKGEVSTWSLPCQLKVFQILSETVANAPAAFLKCGEWVYPMNPGQSPALKSSERTYMFPDVTLHDTSQGQGSGSVLQSVGIVLSNLVDAATVARFERILKCYCAYEEVPAVMKKPPRPPPPSVGERRKSEQESSKIVAIPSAPRETAVATPTETIIATPAEKNWSEKVSDGIIIGSNWISWGLEKGAVYASELMQRVAVKLRRHITPNEVPAQIDPDVSSNMRKVKTATGAAVQVTGVLVMALANLAAETGKHLAPIVREQGAKLVPAKYKLEDGNEDGQQSMDNVMKVAGAGVIGLSMVFVSLEIAGKALLGSLSKASVDTVQHKYGHEAGDVASDAFSSAGNAVLTMWNVKHLGPKAIAKKTVKQTGKAMILQEHERIRSQENTIKEN